MSKAPTQSAVAKVEAPEDKEPKTLSELGKAENLTAAEIKASDLPPQKEPSEDEKTATPVELDTVLSALMAENEKMAAQITHLNSVIGTVVKGKAPPPVKKARPEGNYRLNSPYWDGRALREKGDKMSFKEGKAPQSATLLKD